MELGPTTLLLLVILFAAGTAVMLVIMGKWLDLTGYRYKMETQRNVMNLVQLITSNSPVVKKVTDQPEKLILDANKLDEYENNAKMGMQDLTDQREEWERCCDFLDFDHNFTVHDLVTGGNWTIGNLIFKENSGCYPRRVRGYADLPVVVSQGGDNQPSVAIVRAQKTPLSDLSFWLSMAFVRAYWDDYWLLFPDDDEYTVYVQLDPEIRRVTIHDVDDNHKRVCTHLNNDDDVDTIEIIVCKNFIFKEKTSENNDIVFVPTTFTPSDNCMDVLIQVTEGRVVTIVHPG